MALLQGEVASPEAPGEGAGEEGGTGRRYARQVLGRGGSVEADHGEIRQRDGHRTQDGGVEVGAADLEGTLLLPEEVRAGQRELGAGLEGGVEVGADEHTGAVGAAGGDAQGGGGGHAAQATGLLYHGGHG
ncbi:hypothetical protein QP028_15865 [Corynebacterium suedekumii]|nr:hypothetical protein QP028_15865 [Corynebacterium suedekumii]